MVTIATIVITFLVLPKKLFNAKFSLINFLRHILLQIELQLKGPLA